MRAQELSTTGFKERATVSTPAAVRVQSFGTTVFAEYSALSLEYDAINLGQGFPDFPALSTWGRASPIFPRRIS